MRLGAAKATAGEVLDGGSAEPSLASYRWTRCSTGGVVAAAETTDEADGGGDARCRRPLKGLAATLPVEGDADEAGGGGYGGRRPRRRR